MPHNLAHHQDTPRRQELSDATFAAFSDLVERRAGLVLQSSKRLMVGSRIFKRVRALGFDNFEDYCAFVESPAGEIEHAQLIGVLTTNVTSFFRENHHFEHLVANVLPQIVREAERGRPVRLWSAGCSNGAEPYSLALTLIHHCPELRQKDVKILATDIDPRILKNAQCAIYPKDLVSNEVPTHLQRYFNDVGATEVQVVEEVRSLVTVKPLNLVQPWPIRGRFQAIFCRNVVIYFGPETTDRMWAQFADRLHPHGHLYVGHSERVKGSGSSCLEPCGVTVYRKTGGGV